MSELLEFILGTILEYLISWMETCEYQRFYACLLLSIAAAALTSALLTSEKWHLLIWFP